MHGPRAVTFDFHDTIAIAPAWFALEVRQLPAMVLRTLANRGAIARDEAREQRAIDHYRALRVAIQGHGQEADALTGTQHAVRAVGVDLPDAVVMTAIDEVMAGVRADAAPRPGIIEVVSAFADAGIPMSVISNAVYHPYLEWCLEDWALRGAFTAVVSSASCGYYKSHAGIYRQALQALNVEARHVVHIGDSYRFDVEAARNLGMRTVWLNLGSETCDDCVADVVISDLDGVAPKILALFT